MGKSLIEYITSLGRWGWVVLMDVISGGVGAYLDISGSWGFPTWLWLTMIGAALVITPFIAFHKLRLGRDALQQELDTIKSERPEIETVIRKRHNDFDIEVLNKGEYAEFEAQIEILDGKSFVMSSQPNYAAYWEKTKNDKTELKKGQRDWLKIASLSVAWPAQAMSLRLHYYEITNFEGSVFPRVGYADSTSWIPGNTQIVRPRILLKVTISSKPSMIDGALVRTYELSHNGLSEVSS